MKTTKEKIEIMQAYEDGREIEYQNLSLVENFPWITTTSPNWNWNTIDYRIAEPKFIR